MFSVVKNSWALFLGMLLLMLGNGVQGTLLGIRGSIEGFDAGTMSIIMSGYFIGFLGGSQLAPELIRRVGHVRVFAALASMISACMILYAEAIDPIAWFVMRIVVGFCFSGVYVVAESWLNDAANNENRGQTMSAYLIVQMIGIVAAQMILNLADPAGYTLFIVISVLISISFAPILLSVGPVPMFQSTKRMTLRTLFRTTPLGCVGAFLLGAIFAGLFGMSAVYGTEKGLSTADISLFVAMIYVGGMLCQYPIGWFSDRMDRRILIAGTTAVGAVVLLLGQFFSDYYTMLLVMAFVVGGVSNPLYSLLIAHTNDFLDHDDMAAGSGGLIFINGLGSVAGPFVIGWMMTSFGPDSFFIYLGLLLGLIATYGAYRMTKRPGIDSDETTAFAPVAPSSSNVVMEMMAKYVKNKENREDDATNFTKE